MENTACTCPEPARGTLPDAFLNHVEGDNIDKILEWLQNGGSVNAATAGGQTLLSMACIYQRDEILKRLLQEPNIHLNTKHRLGALNGFTPLSIAAYKGLEDFVSALLGYCGQCTLDKGATTGKGKSALVVASEKGHWEVVECLFPSVSIPEQDAPVINSFARLAKKTKIMELLKDQLSRGNQQERPDSTSDSKGIYNNNTSPRGLVFILNNKFENDSKAIRKGTDADAEKLHAIFQYMGYETEEHKDLSKKDTLEKVKEFCRQDRLRYIGCVVVVVLSHGINRDTFVTVDNGLIEMSYLFQHFSDTNCPHMKGKAKIFFLQFCRGGDSASQLNLIKNLPRTDSMQVDVVKEASTDIMSIYSVQEGFTSYRLTGEPHDPFTGTPFVEALCIVLRTKGNLWLDDLLRAFIEEYKNTYAGQPMDCHNLSFSKKFCFNPTKK